MNTIDFTETYYIDRRGSHSRKWDGEHLKFNRTDLLPLLGGRYGFYAASVHTRGYLYLCKIPTFRLYHDKSQVS